MKKRMQLNFMAIAMISMIAVLLLTTVVFYNLFHVSGLCCDDFRAKRNKFLSLGTGRKSN